MDLSDNRIVDAGPLRNLVNLRTLNLAQNRIVDATALQTNTGLGTGDLVDLQGNSLNHDTVCRTIPSLLDAGAQVLFEGACPGQIEGLITDSTTGQPVASATVVALTIGSDFGFGSTDLGGLHVIDDLPSGPYTLALV